MTADLAALQDAADRFVAGEEVLPESMSASLAEAETTGVDADEGPPLPEPSSPATAAVEPPPEAVTQDQPAEGEVVAAVE